jgi:hypothetical protein
MDKVDCEFSVTQDGLFIVKDIDGKRAFLGPFDPKEFIKNAEQARLKFEHTPIKAIK